MGEETLASESSAPASRPGRCEVQPAQSVSRPGEVASRRSPIVSEGLDNLGADGAPARLGIMGGTFDPIHIGHLACAEQVREAYGLDAVAFIPAGSPVFKRDRDVTPADDRLQFCPQALFIGNIVLVLTNQASFLRLTLIAPNPALRLDLQKKIM